MDPNAQLRPYRIPLQVLVYCYRRRGDIIEYLMLRRTPKYEGFWQGVTGAPEGTESLEQAAHRELFEETQFTATFLRQLDLKYTFPMQENWKWAYHPETTQIDEYVFLTEWPPATDPVLSFEHDAFRWAPFDDALALLKWPNNRDALIHCNRLLTSLPAIEVA
jgi:dATP pyrophosphohydrolase